MKLSLRQREAIAVVMMALGVVVSYMGSKNDYKMMALGAIVMALSIVLHVKLARCPHCGVWLGKMTDSTCGKCGKKIDDNMKY